MKSFHKTAFFATLILCFPWLVSVAQKDTTKLNREVEVVKAYRPTVSKADKINLLPELNDTTRFRPDLNYGISSHPILNGFTSSKMKAADHVPPKLNEPAWGKISGGFGTYTTPFLDLSLNNPNLQDGTLGLMVHHLSSSGNIELKSGSKVDAPFSNSAAALFGSYVYEGITLSSEISWQREQVRFYGYPVSITDPATLSAQAPWLNRDKTNQEGAFLLNLFSNANATTLLHFRTGIKLNYLHSTAGVTDKAIHLNGDFSYPAGNFKAGLQMEISHYETDPVTVAWDLSPLSPRKSNWIRLTPTIGIEDLLYELRGGINLYATFDDLSGNNLKLYPQITAALHTEDKRFTAYGKLEGSYQFNDYASLSHENRWVDPNLTVLPSNRTNWVTGGITAKLAWPLTIDLHAQYGKTDNQYFFVTHVVNRDINKTGTTPVAPEDLLYNNAFSVSYDELTRLDLAGKIDYLRPGVFFSLEGHYYTYSTKVWAKPAYQPDFTLQASTGFNLTPTWKVSGEINLVGPRQAILLYVLPLTSSQVNTPIYHALDAMAEINLGCNYQLHPRLGLMGAVENLLNRKDEPWYGYTVQGIRFKAGVSFSF
ncbi:MAG: hypothetical protein LWW85_07195 [Marinilabiliales bacterium]|nr:hypothetical protein [Marinilabiliales bacterium]